MELDNHLLAVVEPAILPTEIKIDNLGEDGGGNRQTKAIGTLKPFVLVNSYQFGPDDIEEFELECLQIGHFRNWTRSLASTATASLRPLSYRNLPRNRTRMLDSCNLDG